MSDNKITDKLKEINTEKLQNYYQQNSMEIFTVLALAVGAISSSWDFFTGPKLTILVFTLCAIAGIFLPDQIRKLIRQFYRLVGNQHDKTTVLIVGAAKLVVAIFVPFILFGAAGLLAGTAFNYFLKDAGSDSSSKTKGNVHDNID